MADTAPNVRPVEESQDDRLRRKLAQALRDPVTKRRLAWIKEGLANGTLIQRPPS